MMRKPHNERGAILLFTVIGMVALLSFSALAIDIGMRNQLLARDQNAIDAATLAAAYKIATSPGAPDYDGASALVKEMIEQNLGMDAGSAWIGCEDDDHLTIYAPSDVGIGNECISFGLNANGEYVARVTLPPHSINTIFGGVTGTNELKLSATAGADGNECPPADPGCAGPGTTTTIATSTTVFDQANHCTMVLDEYNLMVYNWATCSSYFPGLDVDAWWTQFCEASVPPVVHTYYGSNGGPDINWTIYEYKIFTSRWDQCLAYSDNAAALTTQRNNWLPAKCNDFQFDWAFQYAKNGAKHWDDCIPYWGPVYNTWLTTPTTTTTAAAVTTTLVPTTTVPAPPTSIDINS